MTANSAFLRTCTSVAAAVLFFGLSFGYCATQYVAILETVSNGKIELSNRELNFLTDELRKQARVQLPSNYTVMTRENITELLPPGKTLDDCSEDACLATIGKSIGAEYIARGTVGKFGKKLTLTVELYDTKKGNLLSSITARSSDADGLIESVQKEAPAMFKIILGTQVGQGGSSFNTGIFGVSTNNDDFDLGLAESHLVEFLTEPSGAVLSLDGVPLSDCRSTPCTVEVSSGEHRIVAALERYSPSNEIVKINKNGQKIRLTLNPNFGVLNISPSFPDNLGGGLSNLSVFIDGKQANPAENRLSPGKHTVLLTHLCYENIQFTVGVAKGGIEIFDKPLVPKEGGLSLKTTQDGKSVSEIVFVNGQQVGSTPYAGKVPVCSVVEVGAGRQKVSVSLKYRETVQASYEMSEGVESVKIGSQIWMKKNLNIVISEELSQTLSHKIRSSSEPTVKKRNSMCYDNKEENCKEYGRLYDWKTAMTVCPAGWHLPSDTEWTTLTDYAGNLNWGGKKLKAKIGWNESGGGTDSYGFSALPGGGCTDDGFCGGVGQFGFWWSAAERLSNGAYGRGMFYDYVGVSREDNNKSKFFSVRCIRN